VLIILTTRFWSDDASCSPNVIHSPGEQKNADASVRMKTDCPDGFEHATDGQQQLPCIDQSKLLYFAQSFPVAQPA
jgi:hypothetical protein